MIFNAETQFAIPAGATAEGVPHFTMFVTADVPRAECAPRESLGSARIEGVEVKRLSRDAPAPWHNASDVKLRNAHLAAIDRNKVVDYLLNEAHPDNGGKARFFVSLGYSRENPESLIEALRDVAEHGEVVSSAESVHGQKYVVDSWLSMQHSRDASVVDQDGLDHRPRRRSSSARHRVSWQGVITRDDQGTRSNRTDGARSR